MVDKVHKISERFACTTQHDAHFAGQRGCCVASTMPLNPNGTYTLCTACCILFCFSDSFLNMQGAGMERGRRSFMLSIGECKGTTIIDYKGFVQYPFTTVNQMACTLLPNCCSQKWNCVPKILEDPQRGARCADTVHIVGTKREHMRETYPPLHNGHSRSPSLNRTSATIQKDKSTRDARQTVFPLYPYDDPRTTTHRLKNGKNGNSPLLTEKTVSLRPWEKPQKGPFPKPLSKPATRR